MKKNNLFGHYTTLSGISGILENRKLWATNVSFLNDKSEFKHAIDLVLEVLPKLKQAFTGDNIQKCEYFIKAVDEHLIKSISEHSKFVFVASFTRELDLLSQWRGYCQDDNGYNLIVDAAGVVSRLEKKGVDVKLVDCIYEDNIKRTVIATFLMKYFNEYRTTRSVSDYQILVNEMAEELLKICPSFKDSSYSEEKEVRAIVVEGGSYFEGKMNDNIKYRKGRYCLIPYYELPLESEDIKGIIIGPNPNQELSKRSLLMLSEAKKWGYVNNESINFSSIPYRSL